MIVEAELQDSAFASSYVFSFFCTSTANSYLARGIMVDWVQVFQGRFSLFEIINADANVNISQTSCPEYLQPLPNAFNIDIRSASEIGEPGVAFQWSLPPNASNVAGRMA